jgi:hypothetical protein
MSKTTKFIEVVTGEKVEGGVDLTRGIRGTSTPPALKPEVAGHSSEPPLMFECAWCGAVNYIGETREGALYVCFACHRPMRPAFG